MIGCTYDSEGKPLTVCHELATLRSEVSYLRDLLEHIGGFSCHWVKKDYEIQWATILDRIEAAIGATETCLDCGKDTAQCACGSLEKFGG